MTTRRVPFASLNAPRPSEVKSSKESSLPLEESFQVYGAAHVTDRGEIFGEEAMDIANTDDETEEVKGKGFLDLLLEGTKLPEIEGEEEAKENMEEYLWETAFTPRKMAGKKSPVVERFLAPLVLEEEETPFHEMSSEEVEEEEEKEEGVPPLPETLAPLPPLVEIINEEHVIAIRLSKRLLTPVKYIVGISITVLSLVAAVTHCPIISSHLNSAIEDVQKKLQ